MSLSISPCLRRMFVCLVAMCAAGTVGMLSIAHAQVGKPDGLYYKSWAVVVGVENYLVAPTVPGAVESAHAVATGLAANSNRIQRPSHRTRGCRTFGAAQ